MLTPKEIVLKFWEYGNAHNLEALFVLIDPEADELALPYSTVEKSSSPYIDGKRRRLRRVLNLPKPFRFKISFLYLLAMRPVGIHRTDLNRAILCTGNLSLPN